MTTRVWTELGAFYWRFTVIPVGRGPSGLSGGGRIEFAGGFFCFFSMIIIFLWRFVL